MDPLTALGLASNVLNIIDAGLKTYSEAKDVYQSTSGISRRNELLQQNMIDLDTRCNQLLACVSQEQDPQRLSDNELAVRNLTWKCAESGKKLHKLVNGLKAEKGKMDSLFKAIKSQRSQRLFNELKKEVEEYQAALNSQILIDLKAEMIERQRQKQAAASRGGDALADTITDTLFFPEIFQRGEQIRKAHEDTFKWIFDDCKTTKASRNCFVCWLRSERKAYWMNGKAGSGKSTLMSFVTSDSNTREHLEKWAGNDRLIIATFYFWNSGSRLEKSLEGFLRSIIHQILKQWPQVTATMFPAVQAGELAALNSQQACNDYWTVRKLSDAIKSLAALQNSSQCVCLFIDGLDEFAGDHGTLINLLNEICAAPHIKICVSSRPLQHFKDAFTTSDSLQLEQFTAEDMRRYIKATLKANPQGNSIASNDEKAFKRFVDDISDKASGVFLWVYLVVNNLVDGLTSGNTIAALEKLLDEFPSDLQDLFARMVKDLQPNYQETAAETFRIFFAAPEQGSFGPIHSPSLSILDMMFAEDVTVTGALAHPHGRADWAALADRAQQFKRRMATSCCGLIEFIDSRDEDAADWISEVDTKASELVRTIPRLLHRSVKEFLHEQGVLPMFSSGLTFSDYEKLLAARLITVKTLLRKGLSVKSINSLADYCLSIARHIEKHTLATNTTLVDDVGRICMACARASGHSSWYSDQDCYTEQILESISQSGVDETGEHSVDECIELGKELDIMSYAGAFGLTLYVKEKALEKPERCRRTDKLPLLHAILCSDPTDAAEIFSRPEWQSCLEALLEHGADPNLKFRGVSAWRLRLNMLGKELMSPSTFTRFPRDLTTFLNHGADPNQTLDYASALGSTKVQSSGEDATDDTKHLYSKLQVATEVQKSRRDNGEIEHRQISTSDIVFEVFSMLMDSASASAEDGNAAVEDSSSAVSSRNSTSPPLVTKPTWRLSLLYWATHAVMETADAQEFRARLIREGAKMQQPFIVKVFATPAGFRDGDSSMDSFLWLFCDKTQSAEFTQAWWKAFPNYTIALFPRLGNALLAALHDGGFLRPGGTLYADEILSAVNIVKDGIFGGSPFDVKSPGIAGIFRVGERLRDINFISNEGLLRASRLFRTGMTFFENDLVPPFPVREFDSFARLRKDDGSLDEEKGQKAFALLRDDGVFDDDFNFTEDSGCLIDGEFLPTTAIMQLSNIVRDNGLLASSLSKPLGGLASCQVM